MRQPNELDIIAFRDVIVKTLGEETPEPYHTIVIDNYISGGPGFVGDVAYLIWDSGPSSIMILTRRSKEYAWKFYKNIEE